MKNQFFSPNLVLELLQSRTDLTPSPETVTAVDAAASLSGLPKSEKVYTVAHALSLAFLTHVLYLLFTTCFFFNLSFLLVFQSPPFLNSPAAPSQTPLKFPESFAVCPCSAPRNVLHHPLGFSALFTSCSTSPITSVS